MKTEFKQNVKILSSMVDQNVGVGIVNAVTLLQDNMCEYFKQLKSDGIYMIDKCHAFFVLTKTRPLSSIYFLAHPISTSL